AAPLQKPDLPQGKSGFLRAARRTFCRQKRTGPSTGKIRSFWWARVDSNHRSIKQQIYSLSPLATREHALILFLSSGRTGWRLVYFTTASGVCQPVFRIFWKLFLPAGAWLLCAAG